jgi:hypothetical protein
MKLDVYVSSLQVADLRDPLTIGRVIKLELLGFWGGSLGQEFQALQAFQTRAGDKTLRRLGIVEYAFGGQVLEVRSIENFAGPGIRYTEILLDCGVPIVLTTIGSVGPWAENTEDKTVRGVTVERFLSGLMLLDGRISFRYPQLITRELEAKVTGIRTLDLVGHSGEIAGLRESDRIPPSKSGMPLVLSVEVADGQRLA